jgi:hypothetical protein
VPDSLLRTESPLEFFKEQIEAACERQHVHPQPLTSYYIVSLLTDFVRLPDNPAADAVRSNEPLALTFARALHSAGLDQRRALKQVGDSSLFISGFFSDSLRRSPVDIDYYASLGGYAYGSLGSTDDALSPIFAELSEKFLLFVGVLSEVSERTALTSSTDLLRLYEKWVRTGSRRNGELLVEKGILPNESVRGSGSVH